MPVHFFLTQSYTPMQHTASHATYTFMLPSKRLRTCVGKSTPSTSKYISHSSDHPEILQLQKNSLFPVLLVYKIRHDLLTINRKLQPPTDRLQPFHYLLKPFCSLGNQHQITNLSVTTQSHYFQFNNNTNISKLIQQHNTIPLKRHFRQVNRFSTKKTAGSTDVNKSYLKQHPAESCS